MKVAKHHPHASLVPQNLSLLSSPRGWKGFGDRAWSQGRKTMWKGLHLAVSLENQILQWDVDLERHME